MNVGDTVQAGDLFGHVERINEDGTVGVQFPAPHGGVWTYSPAGLRAVTCSKCHRPLDPWLLPHNSCAPKDWVTCISTDPKRVSIA